MPSNSSLRTKIIAGPVLITSNENFPHVVVSSKPGENFLEINGLVFPSSLSSSTSLSLPANQPVMSRIVYHPPKHFEATRLKHSETTSEAMLEVGIIMCFSGFMCAFIRKIGRMSLEPIAKTAFKYGGGLVVAVTSIIAFGHIFSQADTASRVACSFTAIVAGALSYFVSRPLLDKILKHEQEPTTNKS